jgi:hypothetical protein
LTLGDRGEQKVGGEHATNTHDATYERHILISKSKLIAQGEQNFFMPEKGKNEEW